MIVPAIITGIGIFLAVEALRPRHVRIRLTEADQRPLTERLIDAFFAPAAARVMTVGRMDVDEEKDTLERRLARAGYPAPFDTPESVMGYRLFLAAVLAVLAGGCALVIGFGSGVAVMVMAVAAVFGWILPDRTIADAEKARGEQLMLDAASILDRLAIYVAAGHALPVAVRSVSEKAGGAWVAEFRKIAAHYALHGNFPEALSHVVAASGRLPGVVRVLERIRAAHEMGGGGVAEGLRRMAADARINIKLLITERGYRNAVLMLFPAFLAILASGLVLIAPGASMMLGSFE